MPACVTAVAEGQVVHVDSRAAHEGARGRARVPAHQPSARLPDLRPGRRVRAAGLHRSRKAAPSTRYRERQAVQPGRGLRRRRPLRPQPLHPLHALRALHGRRGARPVLNVSERGDRALHRHVRGAAARPPLGRQRRRPLPGRRAALQGLPAQGARLGARQTRQHLPRLHPGLQHHASRRATTWSCGSARGPTSTSTATSCATTAGSNYRWMNRGDRVEAPLVRDGGRARGHRLGHRARPARPRWSRGRRGRGRAPRVRARLATSRSGWSGGWSTGSGVTAAVQVPLGDEAPLAGHSRPRAPRASARPTSTAPSCSATRATGPARSARLATAPRWSSCSTPSSDRTTRPRSRRRRRAGRLLGDACRRPARATPSCVLPVTTMAEENGTYINRDGRVQRFQQAKARARHGAARPGGSPARCSPGRGPDARRAVDRGARRSPLLGRAVAALRRADATTTSASPGGCWPTAPAAARSCGAMTPELKGFLPAQRHQDAGRVHRRAWSASRCSR